MADTFKKTFTLAIETTKESIEKMSKQLSGAIAKDFKEVVKSAAQEFASVIKSTFRDVISEMKDMLEFSQLSNAQTRELAFNYGFSRSQAYGYSKAMSLVGLESEEDLFYATEQELQQFREAFNKYSNKYEQLYDKGFFEKMQEYQYEMADFKQEMQMEIINFFMNNKETIKAGMIALMDISKAVLQIFSWLLNTQNRSIASTSDIINQYNQTTSSRNSNVNVNNTFNGVAKSDEAWLQNAGSMTYQQVIAALGGD